MSLFGNSKTRFRKRVVKEARALHALLSQLYLHPTDPLESDFMSVALASDPAARRRLLNECAKNIETGYAIGFLFGYFNNYVGMLHFTDEEEHHHCMRLFLDTLIPMGAALCEIAKSRERGGTCQ